LSHLQNGCPVATDIVCTLCWRSVHEDGCIKLEARVAAGWGLTTSSATAASVVSVTATPAYKNSRFAAIHERDRSNQWWAVVNYLVVNYVVKLLESSYKEKFNYSKVVGSWMVV